MSCVDSPDGDDEVTQANVDLVLETTMDLRNGFVRLCYGSNFVSSANLSTGVGDMGVGSECLISKLTF